MTTYTRNPQTIPDDTPGGSTVRQGVADQNSIAIDDLFINLNSHSNNEDGRTHLQIDESLDYIENNFIPAIEDSVVANEEAALAAQNAEASAKVYAQNSADCAAYTADEISKLGTAAHADLTTSNIDTTAGRVLKVGDFGLGGNATIIPPLINDANLAIDSGIYGGGGTGATNFPLAAEYGSLLVMRRNATVIVQFSVSTQTTSIYTRSSVDNGVTWSAWSYCYTNKNILGAVSQSGGVPTGAIISTTGEDLAGRIVKFANGDMEIRQRIYVSTNTASFQDFPWAENFVNTPVVTGSFETTATSGSDTDWWNRWQQFTFVGTFSTCRALMRPATFPIIAGAGYVYIKAFGRWY